MNGEVDVCQSSLIPSPVYRLNARKPQTVLMTVDAVGGVWRYAMDLARGLQRFEVNTVFAGLGPSPSSDQEQEAIAIGPLVWLDAPLDWTAGNEDELDIIPHLLRQLIDCYSIDLLHLNLPSQAAGLDIDLPVVAVSHSCVVTWFQSVRGVDVPDPWRWQFSRNRRGFDRADIVVAPSHSHAHALRTCYGPISHLKVVHNSSELPARSTPKENFALAVGRWWDDGKNGAVLDEAARLSRSKIFMAGAVDGPSGQHFSIKHAVQLGELHHHQVVAVMAQAGIVVSPSLYEPFGLAALEGARAGAALVLADIPTYRELWDGAALFADPHDAAGFADAIDLLAQDERLRKEKGVSAQDRSQTYSLDHQCRSLLNVYASAMQHADMREAVHP